MPQAFRFSLPKRRHSRAQPQESVQEPALEEPAVEVGDVCEEVSSYAGKVYTKEELAEKLWTTDYVPLLIGELEQYGDVSVSRHTALTMSRATLLLSHSRTLLFLCALCQAPMLELVASLRSRRRGELAEDRAALLRLAAVCSALARERSRKIIPFSVAARSLSWLMQRVPARVRAVCCTPSRAQSMGTLCSHALLFSSSSSFCLSHSQRCAPRTSGAGCRLFTKHRATIYWI